MSAIERIILGKSLAVIFAVISLLVCAPLHAEQMIVGVNVVNPMRASVADQNTLPIGSQRRGYGRWQSQRAS